MCIRVAVMLRKVLWGAAMSCALDAMAQSAPPASAAVSGSLQTQVRSAIGRVAAARTRNSALQAQVARMEQENAARALQLQRRNAAIAALQKKLQAAGSATSATTASGGY